MNVEIPINYYCTSENVKMYIEYQIVDKHINILSTSNDSIESNNPVFNGDQSQFEALKNRIDSIEDFESFIINRTIYWNIDDSILLDQIYNWYREDNFQRIFREHNENQWSGYHYCCNRHKELVKKNLNRKGYNV